MCQNLPGTRIWHARIEHAPNVLSPVLAVVGRRVCPLTFELSATQRLVLLATMRTTDAQTAANNLNMQHTTARTHLRRAMDVIGADSLTELLTWANYQQHALRWGPEYDAFCDRHGMK